MQDICRNSDVNFTHLSVAAVITNEEGKFLVHKLERIGGQIFFPKKSHSQNKTLEETLNSVESETGLKVEPSKFLGSIESKFKNNDGKDVLKTTLYMLCSIVETTQRDPEDRDSDSQLVWLSKPELIEIFKTQGESDPIMDESKILERV